MDTQSQNLIENPERELVQFEDFYRDLKVIARGRMAGERLFLTLNATVFRFNAG